MNGHEWDGTERRTAMLADERTRGNGSTVEVPVTLVIVGFVAVALLQFGALAQHIFLSHDHAGDERFRHQITCFVTGSVQGKAGTELLTTCDFLNLGGRP